MNYLPMIIACTLLPILLYWLRQYAFSSDRGGALKSTAMVASKGVIQPTEASLDEPVVIDTAILTRLGRDVSEEMLPVLIDAFLEELDGRALSIEKAIAEADDDHLRIEVHSIKSCARTFGATALAIRAADIEEQIKAQKSRPALQIQQMLAQLPSVRAAFNAYLATLPAR